MVVMFSALEELDRLYREIESEVFGNSASRGSGTAALADQVTRNLRLIGRLEQANVRFTEDAVHWLQRRDLVSQEERDQVRKLVEPLRLRAARLLGYSKDLAGELEVCLARLQGELCQLRNGARFLQSSRPVIANYPKFIDSHG